jgi:pyruvate dehydrogenase E2 component (dihydrolipoyllysine-residue acetyltransferase)
MTASTTTTNVLMPRLSDSMEEGIIVSWLVADGDDVAIGQEIVEVETDKATMPYEAETAGTIHLRAGEGDAVAVGGVIAVIGDAEEHPEAPTATSDRVGAGEPVHASAPRAGNGAPARADASPVARRLAAELGIDLKDLTGSGPRGRIVKVDVRNAHVSAEVPSPGAGPAASPPHAPSAAQAAVASAAASTSTGASLDSAKGEVTTREPSRLQQVVARRMAQSKATAPDFVLKTDVDMEAAVALRAQLRGIVGGDVPLPSYNEFIVKACALALRETPLANGSYEDGRFELHSRVNIGIAVAAPDALVVPTIFDADQKSLGEIARSSRALADKVRQGRITPPELSGGTFSISNLGMFGVDEFTAVINPPQAAILAVGALKPRAVVRDAELVARNTMTISLACDHRILYGADAADFLAHIRRLLEAPGALVL